MLLALGMLLAMLAVVVFVLTLLDNSTANDPDARTSYCWTIIVALASALCFVLRHFFSGHLLTW